MPKTVRTLELNLQQTFIICEDQCDALGTEL